MTEASLTSPGRRSARDLTASRHLWQHQRVWLATAFFLAVLLILDPAQASDSAVFAGNALIRTAPFLILSIAIAASAGATGADTLIAPAFTGAPLTMAALGALAGTVSAVMAFWLASPLMDPSMFVLTAGVLGVDFALAKTLAAFGLVLVGGLITHALMRGGAFADPPRDGIGNGGCGGARIRAPKPVVWRFWHEPERRAKCAATGLNTTLFLAKWLTLAFVLESLMLAWIPAETVTATLGGAGLMPIVTATLDGVPAYLNGYAALPLVGGLISQGMALGAGMAFLIAGGVTSIPAAMAVWALARPPVFALYPALSLGGALAAGLVFQLWVALA